MTGADVGFLIVVAVLAVLWILFVAWDVRRRPPTTDEQFLRVRRPWLLLAVSLAAVGFAVVVLTTDDDPRLRTLALGPLGLVGTALAVRALVRRRRRG